MRRILNLLLLTLICSGVQGQPLDPGDYVYPVCDVSGLCAANFGEMRPGHFHAGVDIKTDGVEGKRLIAAADGYVSRVVISAGGYGRAVYLTLRNGKTAVYGHLQRFRDDIEGYVRDQRCRRQSNSVDLWFQAGQWPVRQGDLIGYSGNSGSSMGPHLHFELRDTPTQKLHNLVREKVICPQDNLPPRIMRIHYIEVDTIRGVPVQSRPQSYAVVREAEGRYRLTREEPVGTGRKGYFVAEVTDRRNNVHNTFGVWRVTASVDGQPYFEYRMDGFTYDLSRCCDAVSCYPMQLSSRNEVLRLAQSEGAPDCFYPIMTDRGMIRTAEGETRRIRIEAEDDCGNRSQLEFTIRGRAGTFRPEADTTAAVLTPGRTARVGIGQEMSAVIPAGALYEPLFCCPQRLDTPRTNAGVVVLSPAYRIFDAPTPLKHTAAVSIRTFVPRELQLRTVLAQQTSKGGLSCVGGTYSNGAVTTRTRAGGPLLVVADTLPPTVQPLFSEGADLSQAQALRFRASDNFSGIAAWTLRLDGQWVPCDRFPMKGTLVHTFPAPAGRQRHSAEISVTDGCGNTARWEGTFYR